jgi:hypothetical protein
MIPVEFTEEFNAFVEENSIDVATQYVVAKLKSKEGKTEREKEWLFGIHFVVVVFLIDWRADSFYAEVSVEECLGKRGDIEIEC